MGADVVKVEEPGVGDEARHWGPPFFGGDSAYFFTMNRDKRSIAVNLKAPEGIDLCLRLAETADVVIENFRPGVAERLGIGFAAIKTRRPDVVYCSISAYGQDGPLSQEPGYDLIMQGIGGLMSVTGELSGRPLKAGVAETDILAGTNAAVAIVGALLGRERSRSDVERAEAQYLDVSLLDGQVLLMGYHLVCYLLSGKVPGPAGNALPYIVPYQAFRTATFEITVAANNDRMWVQFCKAIERPDLLEDDRFNTNGDRVRRREELVPLLEQMLLTRGGEEWLARFKEWGVPAGPINSVDMVASHPQVVARGLLKQTDHPVGAVPVPGMPWRARGEDEWHPDAPPLLGQHTEEILGELGLSTEQISELLLAGIVAGPPQ